MWGSVRTEITPMAQSKQRKRHCRSKTSLTPPAFYSLPRGFPSRPIVVSSRLDAYTMAPSNSHAPVKAKAERSFSSRQQLWARKRIRPGCHGADFKGLQQGNGDIQYLETIICIRVKRQFLYFSYVS